MYNANVRLILLPVTFIHKSLTLTPRITTNIFLRFGGYQKGRRKIRTLPYVYNSRKSVFSVVTDNAHAQLALSRGNIYMQYFFAFILVEILSFFEFFLLQFSSKACVFTIIVNVNQYLLYLYVVVFFSFFKLLQCVIYYLKN